MKSRASSNLEKRIRDTTLRLQDLRSGSDPDSSQILAQLDELALLYQQANDFVEARDVLLDALNLRQKSSDGLGFDFMRTAHRLGLVLSELGDWKWASQVQENVLEYFRHVDGDRSADVIKCAHMLASSLYHLNETDKIAELTHEISSAWLNDEGLPSGDALPELYWLANVQRRIGSIPEASKLYWLVFRGCIHFRDHYQVAFKCLLTETTVIPIGLFVLKRMPMNDAH